MLSSGPKSVPTTKQFRQPYFMDITSDGAVLSTCNRLAALLKRRKITHFMGKNVLEVFSALGKINPALSSDVFKQGLPETIDLAIQVPNSPLFSIRWLTT